MDALGMGSHLLASNNRYDYDWLDQRPASTMGGTCGK